MRPLQFVPILVLTAGCVAHWTSVTAHQVVPSDERDWVSWPGELTEPPLPQPTKKHSRTVSSREPTTTGTRLVARARKLVGLSTLSGVAPHLIDDCVGLVRTVYEDQGIDLMSAEMKGDNGVSAMFRLAYERSAIHTSSPAPGDLVFFRNTYDRNRDGKLNDGLTHVGVVESVAADGTVSFVHRIHGGVKRGKLQPFVPRDIKRNDYLRPAKGKAPLASTGELFVGYASAARLAERPAFSARTPTSSLQVPLGTR